MLVRGFYPIVGKDAQIVVLGTLPGGVSLERQEYYADHRNCFWFIVQQLFGIEQSGSYKERVQGLIRNRIAVWDVLEQAERNGSQDNNIVKKTEVANDFAAFFRAYPSIKDAFFNGGPPKKYFRKLVVPALQIEAGTPRFNPALLSTSNSTRSYTKAHKVENWRVMQQALGL
jgi:double-stranded uracil-DNA glycosylase